MLTSQATPKNKNELHVADGVFVIQHGRPGHEVTVQAKLHLLREVPETLKEIAAQIETILKSQ